MAIKQLKKIYILDSSDFICKIENKNQPINLQISLYLN